MIPREDFSRGLDGIQFFQSPFENREARSVVSFSGKTSPILFFEIGAPVAGTTPQRTSIFQATEVDLDFVVLHFLVISHVFSEVRSPKVCGARFLWHELKNIFVEKSSNLLE